jgi:hypothetical protein
MSVCVSDSWITTKFVFLQFKLLYFFFTFRYICITCEKKTLLWHISSLPQLIIRHECGVYQSKMGTWFIFDTQKIILLLCDWRKSYFRRRNYRFLSLIHSSMSTDEKEEGRMCRKDEIHVGNKNYGSEKKRNSIRVSLKFKVQMLTYFFSLSLAHSLLLIQHSHNWGATEFEGIRFFPPYTHYIILWQC